MWSNLKISPPYQIWLAAAQAAHTPTIIAALSPFVCLRFYFQNKTNTHASLQNGRLREVLS